ncbi:hypothetical protein AtEden1_Chr4g0281211 [Arabidopsis thaliana]
MNSEVERPESPSFDDAGSSNDLCTRPNDIAGPHYQSTCTLQSLNQLGELCRIPAEVMKDLQMPATESLEDISSNYHCPLPYLKELLLGPSQLVEYSRTLLVDASAYRPTSHREGHSGRSSHKERSPLRDSPRPTSRAGLSNEPLADLIRKKRDRSTRSSSSPKRDKTRARTDHSPRPSPPPRSMGPPPPVIVSPSSGSGGEKAERSANPRRDETEVRDAGTKAVLVPQTKSLTVMETEGNVFRFFKTRKDTILPAFHRWRPVIRERFLLHAHHSSRAANYLVQARRYYLVQARQRLDREKEVMTWKDKSSSLESDLRSSNDTRLKLEDQMDNLSFELIKSNGELQQQYQRYEKIQEELSTSRDRLSESESSAYELSNQLSELQLKYKAVANYRDAELARSASKARKKVKGRGMELIEGAIVFIQTEKARTELESNIKEDELKTVLEEKRIRLAALPSSSFNAQQFEEFFTESPPLSESGLDWAGVSDPVEPEVPIAPASIPEAVITPPEIPPSTNSETVVIEDDDGSDSVVPSEQLATGEPDEIETTAADPEPAQTEPEMPENL